MTRIAIALTVIAVVILAGCEESIAPGPEPLGTIEVTSTPSGARVFLDGSDTGRVTPYTIPDVPAGSHTIRLTLEDYQDWGPEDVEVTADEASKVEAILNPAEEPPPAEYGLGLVPVNMEAYRNAPLLRAEPVVSLPTSVDLSPDVPRPGNQGMQGSCVGWAVAYALKTYHERVERGWALNDNRHVMSPAYLYNQIKEPGGGAYFQNAFKVLQTQGVSSWELMPYTALDDDTMPSAAAIAEAANYRIAAWGTVLHPTHRDFVVELKRHLTAGTPVVIGIFVNRDFDTLSESNPIYESYPDDCVWPQQRCRAHALTIVGYSDRMSAFKFINSWGTNWGIGGYGWIDYEDSRSLIWEAYVTRDMEEEDPPPPPPPEPPVIIEHPSPIVFASPNVAGRQLTLNHYIRGATNYDIDVAPTGIVVTGYVPGSHYLTINPHAAGDAVVSFRGINEDGSSPWVTVNVTVTAPPPPPDPEPAGITWRSVDSGFPHDGWTVFFGVAWSGTRFVVVGADMREHLGIILYSSDGISWIEAVMPQGTPSLSDVAWNGTRFVAVGDGFMNVRGGAAVHSRDGISWAKVDLNANHALTEVVATDRRFVVLGYVPGYGDSVLWHSPDGVTWSEMEAGDLYFSGPVWTGDRLFASGGGGNVPVWYSTDYGITWTRAGDAVGFNFDFENLAWNGRHLLALGGVSSGLCQGLEIKETCWYSAIAYSRDGARWTRATTPGFGTIRSASWNGERWVAVGSSGAALHSVDGVTWTEAISPTGGADVAWSGERFVAVGGAAQIMVSP